MQLSNKKIKYIRRQASQKTPEKIAEDLRINIKDVKKVLRGPAYKNLFKKILLKMIPIFDEIFHWGLISFLFLAPFIILRKLPDYADLPKSAFIQIGVVFLFLLFLSRFWVKKKFLILQSPLYLPIFTFILWALISLIYAHNKYTGFTLWMHWAASALMFFLVINIFKEEKWIFRLLVMIFCSGFLCAMIGIAQHLFKLSWIPQVAAPASTFANKNMAVHYIILTLPLGAGFILNNKHKTRDWFFSAIMSIMAGLMIVFLAFTKTRAGWVALIAEFLFFIFLMVKEGLQNKDTRCWNLKKVPALVLAVITILIIINLGPQGFKKGFREIFTRASTIMDFKKEKSNIRLIMWRNTIEMINDNFWIGKGLGNHKVFYPLYNQKVIKDFAFGERLQLANVHNDYLQTFAELGIVGILLLGWIGFWVIKIIVNITSSLYPANTRFLANGIIVGIVGLLVNACFSFPFQCAIPPFMCMTFLGILGSLYANRNKTYYTISGSMIPITGLIFTLALVQLIQFHYFNMEFEYTLPMVHFLEQKQKWGDVITVGKKTYQYNPHRSQKLPLIMGEAYNQMGNYSKSIEALQRLITDYPYCMNALLNIGAAYYKIGDDKRALEAFDTVLRIKPDYYKAHNNIAEIYNNKAKIYMKQKNFQKAYEKFKIAAKSTPRNSIIHFNMGIAAINMMQYDKAAGAINKAIQLNPNYDLAHKMLGIIYLRFLNKEKKGVYHLRKALEINPGIQDATKIQKMIEIHDR